VSSFARSLKPSVQQPGDPAVRHAASPKRDAGEQRLKIDSRRGAGAAERTGFENQRMLLCAGGSNPSLSATPVRDTGREATRQTMERCPSGLRSTLGKRVCRQRHRGFKSRPLRHPSPSVHRWRGAGTMTTRSVLESDGGSGPTWWIGFEPGQTGNGAALRACIQARGARAHRRTRVRRDGPWGGPDTLRHSTGHPAGDRR
jgi:hypothetical protein